MDCEEGQEGEGERGAGQIEREESGEKILGLTLSRRQLQRNIGESTRKWHSHDFPYLQKWQERAEDDIAHSCNFTNTFPIALTTLSRARDEF
jgi:hypothetical protein